MTRFRQGHGLVRIIIGGGEMQSPPLDFSGTNSAARLDIRIHVVLDKLMQEGLELTQ